MLFASPAETDAHGPGGRYDRLLASARKLAATVEAAVGEDDRAAARRTGAPSQGPSGRAERASRDGGRGCGGVQ